MNLGTGLAALLVLPRLRVDSLWRSLVTLFAGVSILSAHRYLVGGYYTSYGDLKGWRDFMPPMGNTLWPVFVILLPVTGYGLGKLYSALQNHWVPVSSSWEKAIVFCLTMGPLYIYKHSQADISHSICPECAKEHYPDFDI